MWQQLNRRISAERDTTDQHEQVLGRLGEYAAQAMAPLNMRPTSVALLREEAGRIEIRVSTSAAHVVLVIAPDADLSGEILVLRSLALRRLPAPRLIDYDVSRKRVPFGYLVLGHIGGRPIAQLEDAAQVRMGARQLGRTLRRLHQTPADGYGSLAASGRWSATHWPEALGQWLGAQMVSTLAMGALGDELVAQVWAATLEHASMQQVPPAILHGNVGPERALVTTGEGVQLEALVQAGTIIGGDPMFDLALGLRQSASPAFRQGLLEGYVATLALTPEQEDRMRRLQLLVYIADALQHTDTPADTLAANVRSALAKL